MPANYPETADLAAALTALGLTAPASSATVLAGAIETWERLTGHSPFLSTGTETEKTFDPPRHREFELAIPVCVSVESVVLDTLTLTVSDDYDLLPLNSTPKSGIRFKAHPGFEQASIVVSADWGYSSTIPSAVWSAILNLAVAECSLLTASGASFSAESMRVDRVQIDHVGGESRVNQARSDLKKLAMQYWRL